MNFANETEFLKAFEVVLESDMQVYLISTVIVNVAVFIIIIGIVYFFCVKRALRTAIHSAIATEMENSKSSHHHESSNDEFQSRAQYRVDSTPVTLTVKDFMNIP
jgi:hypothetical protein